MSGEGRSPVYRSGRGRDEVLRAYREQAARVPFPCMSRFVATAFGPTHVLLAGPEAAPPLVVLPGVHFGAFFTAEWLGEAAAHFRLVVPDVVGQPNLSAETRPAPGEHQYARWLLEVLDQLELRSARMMGISFGGAIVLDVAALAPARLSRVALLVPGGLVGGNPLDILLRLVLPWWTYRLAPNPKRLPGILAPLGERLPPHWYAFFDLLLRHVRWAVQPPGPFGEEHFAGYEIPTLAVFAREDCFFPGDEAAAAAERLLGGNVTTRVIEGRHLPAPDVVAREVRAAIAFFRNG